ncbi:TPA: conjugal transfer protein TraM [Legionella pneumophila]|nr:conjugal transfer protein TraM [Legionella pneumophila]HBD9410594.1 conjugal transfer protein TraM [Legionella pneumophila]
MTDKFDAAIQEIAVKHGVVLSKDDPILILQTMNDRLLEESRQAQAAMLAQFKEEMETISSQWKDNAKEKAEKVLNAGLASSKEIMTRLSKEFSVEYNQVMRKIMSDSLAESRELAKKMNKFSWLALSSAAILIISFLIIGFFG